MKAVAYRLAAAIQLQTEIMLPLPLHCYDEAGRVKPPLWLYWGLVFACTDWFVVIFAVALRGQTQTLLGLFYPAQNVLTASLVLTIPFLVVLILLSQRERLWKKNLTAWRKALVPLIFIGIISSVITLAWHVWLSHGRFEFLPALRLLYLLVGGAIILRSRHLSLMVADWKKPDV